MKSKALILIFMFGMVLFGFRTTESVAIEILNAEDITENVVQKEDIIKMTDNFIVMFDSSGSMMEPCEMDPTMTKLQAASKILKERGPLVPELGYKAGLYLFAPFEELYPMQAYDRVKYGKALDQVPTESSKTTLLQKGLNELDGILQGLSGKTVVFIFTDGTYTKNTRWKTPDKMVAELAAKYNVCFYMITCAEGLAAEKVVQDMASVNQCSRVIPFGVFIVYPDYHTGALFTVKSDVEVQTTTETRIVGVKVDHTLFGFDKAESLESSNAELDELGAFLQKSPKTYAVMAGFTDSVGSEEYNLALSRKRVEHAAAYLTKNFNIAPDRLVLNWYGEADPVADNDTEEGRQLNRRVEIAVGGIE
jgi:OOP family OmpA-OmpF porin